MRVLISAYACEPGRGSEPGVGFACLMGVAERHEVWVVTRANNVESLTRALADHPLQGRIHIVGFDLGRWLLLVKRLLGPIGLHVYYDRWQRALGEISIELDRKHRFDVVHHITFATNWTRFGVAVVDKPLVIGPVGGSVRTPFRMWPALGVRGVPGEILRSVARPLLSWISGARRALNRASYVLAQNPESLVVQGKIGGAVLPNGLVGALAVTEPPAEPDPNRVVFVARLVGWKGASLAIESMRHTDDIVTLDLFGEGPDRRRLERLIRRYGLADRVRLRGKVPRAVALAEIGRAGALIHPALHEESSVTVGEALSLGTPVVCLDMGGPPHLMPYWPAVPVRKVGVTTPRETARALASAVDDIRGNRVAPEPGPGQEFINEILRVYEAVSNVGR